jgi:NTE family protein
MSSAVHAAPVHAARTYLADENRTGTALCLSGGGFRAALFHLGAVRRLYELGILDQVDTIVSVSGGTMLAAFLADRCSTWYHRDLGPADWEAQIAAPFRAFTSQSLNAIPFLIGWLPWNWWNNAGLEAFSRACQRHGLTKQTTLTLPERPLFRFEASNLVNGAPRIFEKSGELPPQEITLAVAVASCFPGAFRPYTKRIPEKIALVDGGVVDNRGIEPVWRDYETLLVSDGGDVLRPQWDASSLWSLTRSARVLWNQSQIMQKRWLISSFISGELHGTYWDIEGSPKHYLQTPGSAKYAGYTPELARDVIAPIRTDYDAFSAAEAAVLENHGYFLTEAAAQAHLRILEPAAPLRVPNPGWMNEAEIRSALRDSAQLRKLFRRKGHRLE